MYRDDNLVDTGCNFLRVLGCTVRSKDRDCVLGSREEWVYYISHEYTSGLLKKTETHKV